MPAGDELMSFSIQYTEADKNLHTRKGTLSAYTESSIKVAQKKH